MSGISISTLKLLAIFSVVVAHIHVDTGAFPYLSPLNTVYKVLGSFGVGIFFQIAGFNYRGGSLSEGTSILSRAPVIRFESRARNVYNLITPWILSASVIYFYLNIRGHTFPGGWIAFFIGAGSYLYFMTIYVGFQFVGKIITTHYVGSVFFLSLSVGYYCWKSIIIAPFGSEHLNILLWAPYFIIGYWMRLCGRQFYLDKCYLSLIILLIFGVVVGVRAGNLSEGLNYRNIMIPLGVQVIFIAAQLNSRISILKLDALSRNTLAIYLWHMPLIGFLNWISNQYLPGLHFFFLGRGFTDFLRSDYAFIDDA